MECGRDYDWNRRIYLRLDRRVLDLEKSKMYDWIVVGKMCIGIYVYIFYMHFSLKKNKKTHCYVIQRCIQKSLITKEMISF